MISLEKARELVLQQAKSFGKEAILLDDATGRVLSQTIIADRDYPPFNRATMDGIAVNIEDWKNGSKDFSVVETIFAGKAVTKTVGKGECYKIMTGASVPEDANAVIRKEDLTEKENRFHVNISDINPFQNIALKGSDIKKGTPIIQSNKLISAGTVTTLASLGYANLQAEKLPSIAIITTGDEIVNIDRPVNEVQIRNSNAHLLKSLLQGWKIKPIHCEHVKDDEHELAKVIAQQLQHDIIILSGAVSAGDADFVPAVLTKAGAKNVFHKAAIRPGKPAWFGVFENGPVVFALPGNPFSTITTFKIFIEPFLHACFGLEQPAGLSLPLAESRTKKNSLDEFFPVAITGNPSVAKQLAFNTSGDITAVLNADALALHPVNTPVLEKGEVVSCILLR